MPRANSTDKFFVHAPYKSGGTKGKQPLGVNQRFAGDRNAITLQDLLLFLEKHNIDPSRVAIPKDYYTLV